MIPRYDGLVPVIRRPASSFTTALAHANPSAPASSVTRYVISSFSTASAETAHTNATAERERRLFIFLPSVDCATPPCELQVSPHYFEDSVDAPEADSDLDSGEDLAEDEESQTASTRGSARQGGAHGSIRKRRRARRREPMRLEYGGFYRPSAEEAAKSVRLVSTPASKYSHLACVLLQLPTSWREQDGDEGVGHARTACSPSSPSSKSVITCTPLRRPILQLWGERSSARVDPKEGHLFSGGNAAGISAAWGSDTPLRIRKKDWKTMDAVEADLHRPTKWSGDDDGDVSDESRGKPLTGADQTVSARARRREKEEGTHTSVRAFLVGAKEALRQQGAVNTAGEFSEQQPAVLSGDAPPVLAQVEAPAPVEVAPKRASVTLQLYSGASGSVVQSSVAAAAAYASPVHPPPASGTDAVASLPPTAVSADESTSLDSLACAVVAGMQRSEARTTATLMELQKRILKQLPEFAAMSEKMRSAATKQEAITWFQTSQRALRAWLVERGHLIHSDGTVTFGAV
ncbi:hypothetical protein GH5_03215 [Leishmania sp. Ghana 2012 LV757]|uniref:hypothetical protein n=1 Tax=Leishmania sp. Ghana 2012 LV757 TaxID=2803181 RepID=UPI001B73B8C9|nr:hypothetical protein GH5_03215 [Leishmania sp. Ghana 2012 LV757]